MRTLLFALAFLLLLGSALAASALAPDIGYAATIGQTVQAKGMVLRPIAIQKNAVLFSVDGARVRVLKGQSQQVKGKTISLLDITYRQEERKSMATFAFIYKDRFKNLALATDEKKVLVGDKDYELTLDFVGQAGGKNIAVFTLNGEKSKALQEREDYVFPDGSRLFVKNILRHRTTMTTKTATATFTIS